MGTIKYSGTYSSAGIETTATENTVIEFENMISSLSFTAIGDPMNVKINNETNSHYLYAGDTLQIEDMRIKKITIVEQGVQYLYHALF